MRKTILLPILLILLVTIVYSQVEPNLTIDSVTDISFPINQGDCLGYNDNIYCFDNNAGHTYIFKYNITSKTLINDFNFSALGVSSINCIEYNDYFYCFSRGQSQQQHYKISADYTNLTLLSNFSISPDFGNFNTWYPDCKLRPTTDEVYCYGTGDTQDNQNYLLKYDIGDDLWTQLVFIPDGLSNPLCAWRNSNEMWCGLGFLQPSVTNQIYVYYVDTNTSTTLSNSFGMEMHWCKWVNDIYYCFAGDDGNIPLASMSYYDPTSNTTGNLTTEFPYPYTSFNGCADKSETISYCIGGYANDSFEQNYNIFKVDFTQLCTPDWSCTGYETCVSPMVNASCNAVTDLNNCGDGYGGNYSEFTSQTCSYPPPITGYVPAHSTSDISGVVIDFGVEFGLQIIAFVGLIALIGIGIWVMHII